MRSVLGRWALGLLAAAALALMLGPRERVGILPEPMIALGETPAETLAGVLRAEAFIPGLRPEAAKQVVWAHDDRRRTALSVVVVHGFSASAEELRPMPDQVAAALGANLFFTRLSGHGADPAALGTVRATDWMQDMAEALEVGRALGERVLVIASSTGAALAAIAAAEPAGQDRVAGFVLMSPNFGVRQAGAHLLSAPFARLWAPVLLGPGRSVVPVNAAHAEAWFTDYPTEALVPMAAVAEAAWLTQFDGVTAPLLVILSDADRVVDPARGREVAGRWGGAAEVLALVPGPGDDPEAHVLAGRILSPDLSPRVTAAVLAWVEKRDLMADETAAPAQPPTPATDAPPVGAPVEGHVPAID